MRRERTACLGAMKAQVDFLGFQGQTILDQGYNVDGGLPTEKPALPTP